MVLYGDGSPLTTGTDESAGVGSGDVGGGIIAISVAGTSGIKVGSPEILGGTMSGDGAGVGAGAPMGAIAGALLH